MPYALLIVSFGTIAAICYGVAFSNTNNRWFGVMNALPAAAAMTTFLIAWMLQYTHSTGFIAIPPERAARHRLHGINGMLRVFQVLAFISAVLGPVLYLMREYGDYIGSFKRATKASYPRMPDLAIVDLANAGLVLPPTSFATTYVVGSAVFWAAGLLTVAILLSRKSPLFRPLYVGFGFSSIAGTILGSTAIGQAFGSTEYEIGRMVGGTIMQTLITIAWTAYFYRSTRVNVTIFDSVPDGDPLASEHSLRDPATPPEPLAEPGNAPPVRQSAPEVSLPRSVAERLEAIRDLHARGLITMAEYTSKRQEILDTL